MNPLREHHLQEAERHYATASQMSGAPFSGQQIHEGVPIAAAVDNCTHAVLAVYHVLMARLPPQD